jgi:hypothetical protein
MNQRFYYCPKCGGSLEYKSCGERERLTARFVIISFTRILLWGSGNSI